MRTLNDIAQDPALTPQDRACLHLFGHAAGGLDAVPCDEFETMFPERFADLNPDLQEAVPGRRAYDAARDSAIRALAASGHVQDPWEHLRVLIRRAGRSHDIEHKWGGLKTPALDAGLSPAEITTGWVWGLDAEAAGGFRRQRLRRAATLFNTLFDIPEIAASGLLPSERIGPPPVYDRRGDLETPLPPKLARICEIAPQRSGPAIKRIWRIIQNLGLTSLADPDADDLLTLEPQIAALTATNVGHPENTWKGYRQSFFAALRPHGTQNKMPASLAALETHERDEGDAIKGLWDQMRFAGIDNADSMTPVDILALDTWRAIWTPRRPDLTVTSEKTYRNAARRVLLRAAPQADDPARVVRRAWADLPAEVKTTLAPIRKAAERAMRRPDDVTPAWVADQGLSDDERATVIGIVTNLEATLTAAQDAARPEPVEAGWKALRKDAEGRGFPTRGLGKVETRAIADARRPDELDIAWAQEIADTMTTGGRAKFTAALRLLDTMRADPDLARRLSNAPISTLQDKRRHGRSPIPSGLAQELAALAQSRELAHNTLRSWKSAAAALADITGAKTLAELMTAPVSAQESLGDHQRRALRNIKKAMG